MSSKIPKKSSGFLVIITFLTLTNAFDNNLVLFLIKVSAGTKTIFYQDVVAINPAKKDYSVLGAVTANTKAVVTPDLDSVDLLKD